jgi:glucose-6-phosphate 1-epimerase
LGESSARRYDALPMSAPTTEQLNRSFASVKGVRFEPGEGGLTRLAINTRVASAHIYLHGAHVTHFQPAGHKPVLFLSGRSAFSPGKAIRGGIPVIFPWFGPGRTGEVMHGFLRNRAWDVSSVEEMDEAIVATFSTASDGETKKLWPYEFAATLRVHVGQTLDVSLGITNRSSAPFEFEEALHTYFLVGDVREVSVHGLADTDYLDKVLDHARAHQHDEVIRPTGPVDRVYVDTAATCTIEDRTLARRILVDKSGSRSTVVWNPWADNMAKFADLAPDDWLRYLCVETVNAKDNCVTLPAGASHEMRATIRTERHP